MKRSLTITERGILLVCVPLVFELILTGFLTYFLSQADADIYRLFWAKSVVEQANLATVETMRAIESLKKNGALQVSLPLSDENSSVFKHYENLRKMLVTRPKDLAQIDQAGATARECLRLSKAISQLDANDPVLEHKLLRSSLQEQLNDQTHTLLAQFDLFIASQERSRSGNPIVAIQARQAWLLSLMGLIAFSILVNIGLAVHLGRGIGKRLMVINQNSRNLPKGLPLLEPLSGSDEIAQVDRVFHEMAERLKDLDRMKREFVAMISHDLKSPLTSLQGLMTLLESGVLGELPEKARLRIQPASDDIDRLIRLINELLDVERFESGKITLQPANVSMLDLIKKSVASVKTAADARKIKMQTPHDDVRILCDADRIIQVIVNFLGNAIKFSPNGSSIEIDLMEKKDSVQVVITDHGRGIPESKQREIFERFKQVEASDATEKGGTGLGLAICKEIIEAHGGTVGVRSGAGGGAQFWFQLPKDVSLFG